MKKELEDAIYKLAKKATEYGDADQCLKAAQAAQHLAGAAAALEDLKHFEPESEIAEDVSDEDYPQIPDTTDDSATAQDKPTKGDAK